MESISNTEQMKTGVLIHGCNLHAENWRHLAWGEAPGQMGRIPQGLLAAMTMDAEVVVFGTGASRKRFDFPGSPHTGEVLLEAEFTKAFLESRIDDLFQFKAWSDACPARTQTEWDSLKQSLLGRIRLDTESSNTVGELRAAGNIFVENECKRVVLISSPTHLVRVLRDASKVYQGDRRYESFQDHLLAMPCTTCYEGSTVADVVVVEPPHRPDRHAIPTHRRIARMLSLQKLEPDTLVEFISEFDELLQRYEDRLLHPTPLHATLPWPTLNTMDATT